MFESAHQDYDRAISLAPHNSKLWHAKGLAFESQADEIHHQTQTYDDELMQLAIDMFSEAIRLQENFISSRFHLGLMFHKTKKYQEALKQFSKVLSNIPNDKTVYIARGMVF